MINVDSLPDLTHLRSHMDRAIAADEKMREWLRTVLSGLVLDVEALQRPLKRCQLSECRGTCCHDGVYLDPDEEEVIRDLVETSRSDFEELGLDLPDQVVVFGSWQGTIAGPKTAVRPAPMKETVSDYPPHFPDTACVFLLDDARCALQVIARQRELPAWHYKPLACWLHPLSLDGPEDGPPILTLHSELHDPQRSGDYDGFVSHTHCGRTCEGGEPGYRVLSEEIQFLGGLAGRDLIAEIEAILDQKNSKRTPAITENP